MLMGYLHYTTPPCCMFVMFKPDEGYLFVYFSTNNTISSIKPPFKHSMLHQTLLKWSSIGSTMILLFWWIIQSNMCNWQCNSRVFINWRSMCTACTEQILPIGPTTLHDQHTHHHPYILSYKSVIYMLCVGC